MNIESFHPTFNHVSHAVLLYSKCAEIFIQSVHDHFISVSKINYLDCLNTKLRCMVTYYNYTVCIFMYLYISNIAHV